MATHCFQCRTRLIELPQDTRPEVKAAARSIDNRITRGLIVIAFSILGATLFGRTGAIVFGVAGAIVAYAIARRSSGSKVERQD